MDSRLLHRQKESTVRQRKKKVRVKVSATGSNPQADTRNIFYKHLKLQVMRKNDWLNKRSNTFSTLCGENFTHGEVLGVHAWLLAMLLMGAIVNSLGTLF